MSDQLERFRGENYLSLESFRRDGSGVVTPIWFVLDGDRLFCRSWSETYKVKRIRRNPRVTVAPCDYKGKVKGERFAARVEMLPESESARLRRLFGRKYPFGYYTEHLFLNPLRTLLSRVRLSRRLGGEVFYEIIPE